MPIHQTHNLQQTSFIHRSIFYYLLAGILIFMLVNFKLALETYTHRQFYIYEQYPDTLSKIFYYDNVNRIAPYADQLEELAYIYLRLGQHNDAVTALKRAMRVNPKASDHYRQVINSMNDQMKQKR